MTYYNILENTIFLLYKIGETYLQVTRLLQGYIENEVNLNKEFTCKETCSFYKYAQVEGCYKEGYCAQQPTCNGKVLKCQYVDSDMWICPAVSHK